MKKLNHCKAGQVSSATFARVMMVLLGVISLGMWSMAGLAQLPTATVLGTVRDSSGAVVPGAALSARNTETGQMREVQSGAEGAYRFSSLPVGSYEIRVEHTGFQTEVRSGLTLSVSQEAVINIELQVGAVENVITVTGEAPLINTTSGSLGGLVDAEKVAELPLNGRNYIDLTLLQPGVQRDNITGGGPQMAGTWFSSNGAPPRSNNYLLDGTQMDSFQGNSSASITGTTLGVDGIREFRVVTNSFSAEYGMRMGSQMMIVSKAGTNQWHGSLFEFHRDSALDARDFFDQKTDIQRRRLPAFTRNQFGGSVGGPITQDKTFFFVVYEDLRERLGRTLRTNTIGAGCKGGAGNVITNTACPQLGNTASATIAPQMAPLLALYPNPNLPNNQLTFPYSQPSNDHYGQVRGDHSISGSNTLFGRYTVDDGLLDLPTAYPGFLDHRISRSQFATISDNHIVSPVLLNTVRASYSRTRNLGLDLSETIGPQYSLVPGEFLGAIQITGVSNIGGGGPSDAKQNIYTLSDDVAFSNGSHNFKFGTLLNYIEQYKSSSSQLRGQVRFAGVAQFLTGVARDWARIEPGSRLDRAYDFNTYGFYAQDDWRVSNRLTMNLGLRYEFHDTFQETGGLGSSVRDLVKDSEPTLGIPFKNPSKKNLSPRFGFAWDTFGDGKMAVRGGFGLLYDIGLYGGSLSASTTTPPFSRTSSFTNTQNLPVSVPLVFPSSVVGRALRIMDFNTQQPHIMQYNFAIERQLPGNMALTVAYGGSRGYNLIVVTEGNPTIPQILPDGRKFWLGTEPRTNPLRTVNGVDLGWDNIELRTGSSNSLYNSLQVGLQKRLSGGLQMQGSYTFAKSIDETQGQLIGDSSVGPPDPSNIKLDRAPAGFDVNQNLTMNAIYKLPNLLDPGSKLAVLLNGWMTSGIVSLRTGFPVNPRLGTNRSRSRTLSGTFGGTTDRPDLVTNRTADNISSGTSAGCGSGNTAIAAGTPLGTVERFYDPCAFTLPELGFLGNAARNVMRGPGQATVDISLGKDFALTVLGESGKLEFNSQFFNILNHANFGNPSESVDSNIAGLITATRTKPRQIQLSLRLAF